MTIGNTHTIDRENVYADVVSLYSKHLDEIVKEFPFHIKFKGEIAVDIG